MRRYRGDRITGAAAGGCGAALYVGECSSFEQGGRLVRSLEVKHGRRIWAYGFVLFLLGRAARCIFFTPLGFFFGVSKVDFVVGKRK